MSQAVTEIKGIASIDAVSLAYDVMERLCTRDTRLPGIGVYSGFSGLGKTTAACKLVNAFDAVHVTARSFWSRKNVLEAILHNMGIKAENTVTKMFDQITRELAQSGRPLIIDEVDYLVDKNVIEIIRDIHDASEAPILLIGEERLPGKLLKWERVHGRVMAWAVAPKASIEDAEKLAVHYAAGITVTQDLLAKITVKAKGSVRRISNNLDQVASFARTRGLKTISLAEFDEKALYTGEAPEPRRQL